MGSSFLLTVDQVSRLSMGVVELEDVRRKVSINKRLKGTVTVTKMNNS